MKLMAKPISSPSRTDNFPPPLLRFLRSNGGSKSRGRSRSSPLFIRKKTEIHSSVVITQEPSSPEVTCMGQVRGTTSKNKRKKKLTKKKKNRCEWIQNTLFCRHLDRNNSNSMVKSKPVWRRWGLRKKLEINEDSSSFTPVKPVEFSTDEESVTGEEEDIKTFITKTPPKNALLLMRCRSEPYRDSSLANQFWGSPDEETETDTKKKVKETESSSSSCRDSFQEPRLDTETEMKLGFCQGLESSSSCTRNSGEMEAEISTVRPVVLQRCKSEPARRSEKFEPDICLWKQRLGFV